MAEEFFTEELLEKMARVRRGESAGKPSEKDRETDCKQDTEGELNMSVSPICSSEDGKKYAFVTFEDGKRSAEGRIPECSIIRNRGFSDEEAYALCGYMKANLSELKRMAAGNNVLKALMK